MRALVINQSLTKRSAVLDRYLNDISRVDLLKSEDELELYNKIKAGDAAAKDKLINANLRFVVSVAKKYQHQGMDLEDLICEGNIGLLKAAERFDGTKGFKFISFAVWWIRQAIMMGIADKQRMVRLPGNHLNGIIAMRKAVARLEQQLERVPSNQELADFIELPLHKIEDYISSSQWSVSLDKESDGESNMTLLDILPDTQTEESDHLVVKTALSAELERLLKKIPERDRVIITLHYGIGVGTPMELEDIALLLKLNKERVRQIKCNAVVNLRHRAGDSLRSYFN